MTIDLLISCFIPFPNFIGTVCSVFLVPYLWFHCITDSTKNRSGNKKYNQNTVVGAMNELWVCLSHFKAGGGGFAFLRTLGEIHADPLPIGSDSPKFKHSSQEVEEVGVTC